MTRSSLNPYTAPSSAIGPIVASTADPAIIALRLRHVRHERAVRTLGLLMYALAAWMTVASIVSLLMPGASAVAPRPAGMIGRTPRTIGFVVGHLGGDALWVGLVTWIGVDLRRLREWARWIILGPAAAALFVLAAVVLIQACHLALGSFWSGRLPGIHRLVQVIRGPLVVGSILAYLLTLLGSERAAEVFSDLYRAAVAATPELNPRASLLVRASFGLLMAGAGLALLTTLGNLLFFR